MSRLPLFSTLIVAAAVVTMIGLGLWQLGRLEQKQAMIARYEQAQALSSTVPWPRDVRARERALFRNARIVCDRVLARGAVAGRSFSGEPGWAHTARCALDGGGAADVVLGWSRSPLAANAWNGGEALGFVAPGAKGEARLIAAPPLAGLEPSARPDPRDVPNNHLAYAFQWFFFAIIAAVIYALALSKRLAGARGES